MRAAGPAALFTPAALALPLTATLLSLLTPLTLLALAALFASGIGRLLSTIGARLSIAGFKTLGRQLAPWLGARLLSALSVARAALLAP